MSETYLSHQGVSPVLVYNLQVNLLPAALHLGSKFIFGNSLKVLRLLSITLVSCYWQTVEDLGGLREPEQGQQLTHVGLPRTLTPPVSHMDSPALPSSSQSRTSSHVPVMNVPRLRALVPW
ncbi:hypothetical protein Bbelb_204240 [Branchiostoma belcheri]|nr:hypothetical protein Bbelb_204240 [Branchiostoma belcheri]